MRERLSLCLMLILCWESLPSLAQEGRDLSTNPPHDIDDTIDRGIGVQEMPGTLIVLKKQPLTINCSVIAEKGFEPLRYHWKKDSQVIKSQEHSRVRVLENGTLHFKQIIHRGRGKNSKSDEGFYECFVENRVGTIIGRRVAVQVARISKTFSQEPVSQIARIGSTVVFNCAIHAVTEPHYAWEKDRQPIAMDNTKYLLHHSGKLQINNVHPSDAGSYKCIAANKALFEIGESVPFRWRVGKQVTLDVSEEKRPDPYLKVLVAPANQTTARIGDMATLECIVDSYPQSIVTWTKDGHEVLFPDVDKLQGGSLRFWKVKKEHAGNYRCQAKLSDSEEVYDLATTLKVIVEPVIEIGPRSAVPPVAKLMILHCKVTGEPQPTVRWLKDGQELFTEGRIKTLIKDDTNMLRIYGVHGVDSGYYQCLAENEAGSTSSIARMKIELMDNAPNRPDHVTVKVISSTEVDVSWHIQEKNDWQPIISFTVHYREDKRSGEEKVNLTKTNNATIRNLKPRTNYTVYVKAYKKSGVSPSSDEVQFTTLESVPQDFPRPTLESKGSSNILVEWEPLPVEVQGGIITQYTIYYKPVGGDIINNISVDGKTNHYLITDLKPDSEYEIRMLAATKNGYPTFSDVKWPWIRHRTLKRTSNSNNVTPKVTVEDINMTMVKVIWKYLEPIEMTKQVIFLRILRQSATWQMYSMDGNMREIYFQNLAPETMYEFFILGEHSGKQTGMVTKIFTTRSNRTAITNLVPNHLVGIALLPDAIDLRWRYMGDNSHIITHYLVRYKPIESDHMCSNISDKTIMTHSQETVLTGLEAYTVYNISVCAVFEESQSDYSKPLVIRTLEDGNVTCILSVEKTKSKSLDRLVEVEERRLEVEERRLEVEERRLAVEEERLALEKEKFSWLKQQN